MRKFADLANAVKFWPKMAKMPNFQNLKASSKIVFWANPGAWREFRHFQIDSRAKFSIFCFILKKIDFWHSKCTENPQIKLLGPPEGKNEQNFKSSKNVPKRLQTPQKAFASAPQTLWRHWGTHMVSPGALAGPEKLDKSACETDFGDFRLKSPKCQIFKI